MKRQYSNYLLVTLIGLFSILSLCLPLKAAGLSSRGRELLWNGRPVHLVGFSYYGLLGDRRFDSRAFLENLAAHNINFTRFFLILPWPLDKEPNLLPFRKVGEKYDLRQFDEAYFRRLRSIVKQAEKLGIICQVCLFDRCGLSVSDRRAWLNNPYNRDCNVNGFLQGVTNGYPPFCYTQGPIADINSRFIGKVVETIGDCPNVIYELINEPYNQLGPLPQWHAWAARILRRQLQGRSGSKVISAGQSSSYDNSEINLFAMHSASDDRRVAGAILQSKTVGKPVILSDDGDIRSMFKAEFTLSSAERAMRLEQHFEHLAYTLTLQREMENRPAAHLYDMPGICRLNLRRLADLAVPFINRPYLRYCKVIPTEQGPVFSARLEQGEKIRHIFGQVSDNNGRSWSKFPVIVNRSAVTSKSLSLRKGQYYLLRGVCVDQNSQFWPGPAVAYSSDNRRSILLAGTVVEKGLLRIRPNIPDGVMKPVKHAGKACYEVDLARKGRYAYFRLEEFFPKQEFPASIAIIADYFDHPAGARLFLEYDGAGGAYTPARPLVLKGSGQWKTISFSVDNAVFKHRQNDGADFRLSLREPASSLALRSIRVENR